MIFKKKKIESLQSYKVYKNYFYDDMGLKLIFCEMLFMLIHKKVGYHFTEDNKSSKMHYVMEIRPLC